MAHTIGFSAARAVRNRHDALIANSDRLHALMAAVNCPGDVSASQWGQLTCTALEFRPDLIIEFGRAMGNSTALFTEAAQHLPACRVLSFCLSTLWQDRTKPRVASLVPPEWFAPLTTHVGDLRAPEMIAAMDAAVSAATRVLVFWDAHGFAVAEFLLGRFLPRLAETPHLVLMHDLTDIRYSPASRAYGAQGLWRGGYDQGLDHDTRVVLGPVCAAVEQAVAIVDFTSRNQVDLHSADHELHTELTEDERSALAARLGDLWGGSGHGFWFTTFGVPALTYPRWDPDTTAPDNDQIRKRLRDIEASRLWKVRSLAARLMGRS